MANVIYPANAADWVASPVYHGNILALGNSGTYDEVGAVVVQFSPSQDFAGEFAVVARARNQPNAAGNMPFMAVPYIATCLAGAAQLRTLTTATVTGLSIIEIPANGLEAGLMVSCTAGTCDLAIIRLSGTVNGHVPAEV